MQENKKGENSSEKIKGKNVYYILVSACALMVAAAIVLAVVFTTRTANIAKQPEAPSEQEQNVPDKPTEPSEPDTPEEPDKPSNTEIVFSVPVASSEVGTGYSFWYNSTLNRYGLHEGIDFKAEEGTAVTAAYTGTVQSVTENLLEGGKVVLDHGNGLYTVYQSVEVGNIKVGDVLHRGDQIGTVSAASETMGNEYNEGAHLHFEVRKDGKSVDPITYLELAEK